MNPEIWGSHGWKFIHSIAISYPEKPSEEDKIKYKQFFISVGDVLPCESCQKHYKKNVVMSDLDKALTNNKTLFKWTVSLHNKVNRSLNKREFSVMEALNELEKEESNIDYKVIIIIIILFLYITK